MSSSTKLPAILQQPHGNSLSVERVLKLAAHLIQEHVPAAHADDERAVNCYDDLQTMINSIDRG